MGSKKSNKKEDAFTDISSLLESEEKTVTTAEIKKKLHQLGIEL